MKATDESQSTNDAASESESSVGEMLLAHAAAAAQAAAWQWNLVEHTVDWTTSLADLFDLDSIEFDGTPDRLAELIHPDDREPFRSRLHEAVRTGNAFDTEVRTRGSRWVHIGIAPVQKDGRVVRVIGTAVAIDARKQTESLLLESEQRFAKLFHASPLNVTISSLDTGRFVDVNDTFVALTGYSREQAIGRTALELGIWPSAEDRKSVMDVVQKMGTVRNRIVRMQARGGEERIGSLSVEHITIRGQSHLLALFEDITARERAQAALHDSEQRLRLALRAASAGVWQTNTLTGETFWSDEFRALYGYDELAPAGRETWATHLHPEDRERMLTDLLARLKPGTDEYRREFRILHPTRGLRWILALGQIERNEQGRALNMTGISIDITRIKEVEKELREADQRKNEFLAVLSHELRNPLAPLRNGLEILRLTRGTGELADKARVMMARQLEQMVHLIDDLLEVSRISRGKIELKRAALDLTNAIQHALEASKPLIDAAGHTLSIDVPPGPLIIEADLTRLAQVLGNLLNNAAKYTNPGGHIRLSVQRAGDRVSISVRDTGIGIPVDMLPKIFDMFAQLDSSTQRTQGGLGIGLSIAQRLVEMHGGTLEARSEGLGKGSEFVVELPLHGTSTAQDAAPTEPQHAQSNERSLRVLVADDNEDAAASLAMVLEMKGHQARTAHDGVEAVQIAERFTPDVAILDIGMPRLDGYEVCKQLRAQPHGRDMLIVALTGWGQTEDKQRSRNAGFDHHLVKPANVGALEELLSSRESKG